MYGLMVYIHEKEERSYMKSLHASASTRAKAKAFCRTDRSRPADLVVGGIAHYNILSRRSDFIKEVSEKQEQTVLQANQDKQLEYAHCRIIRTKKFLNEQIKKKILQDRFTK